MIVPLRLARPVVDADKKSNWPLPKALFSTYHR